MSEFPAFPLNLQMHDKRQFRVNIFCQSVCLLLSCCNTNASVLTVFSGVIGMAAFTVEIYRHAQTKTISFAWSYYIGWTAIVITLAAILYGIKGIQRVAGEPC